MGKQEEIKVTVPLSEVLEILRLVTNIEYPNCTYVPEESLLMADNAIRQMKQSAGAISNILYTWTHVEQYYKELVNGKQTKD